jgi:hypothetical protein
MLELLGDGPLEEPPLLDELPACSELLELKGQVLPRLFVPLSPEEQEKVNVKANPKPAANVILLSLFLIVWSPC